MGEVIYNGVLVKYDDEHSFRIHGAIDVELPDDAVVYCSNYSHEEPSSSVFPRNMKGVVFINCNLDNCQVPQQNTIIGGSNRMFQVQNDGNDWEIDAGGRPVRILNGWLFAKFGVPEPAPSEIPAEKVAERIDWIERKRERQ